MAAFVEKTTLLGSTLRLHIWPSFSSLFLVDSENTARIVDQDPEEKLSLHILKKSDCKSSSESGAVVRVLLGDDK